MKRAGIVTFYDADNFGAMLQAYALRVLLLQEGVESSFLSLCPPISTAPETDGQSASPLLKKIRSEGAVRSAHFADFRAQYLPAIPFSCVAEEKFDLFVAGSDQIWNDAITGGDQRYFLTFAPPEKRFSYAASFGSADMAPEHAQQMAGYLNGFAQLSVREQSGQALVKSLTGRDAQVFLDPTLVLRGSDWEKLLAPAQEQQPYLLAVLVQNDPAVLAQVRALAVQRGLALRLVTASYFPMAGFAPWSGVSVTQWLRLVHDAQCVVTSSFHGLVFSVLFEREIFFVPLKAELAARNGRSLELLDRLGLSGRGGAADWAAVSSRLEPLRQAARDYLHFICTSQTERGD